MAMRASVTVSIAAESTGILSWILRVSRVLKADVAGQDFGKGGDEQDVVEGESFLEDTHSEPLRAKRHYTGGTGLSQAMVFNYQRGGKPLTRVSAGNYGLPAAKSGVLFIP
jgi:hypothetical protein